MERVGVHYKIPPQELATEETEFVPAGALTIGVEYRRVDAEALRETYAGTEFESIYADDNPDLSLVGVSLHVCDAKSGQEFVRFDCFDDEPHYHYIHTRVEGEDVDNHVIWFDSVAHGRLLPWALNQIRTRLPEMLAEAGAPDLAAQVDSDVVGAATTIVESIAEKAIANQVAELGSSPN